MSWEESTKQAPRRNPSDPVDCSLCAGAGGDCVGCRGTGRVVLRRPGRARPKKPGRFDARANQKRLDREPEPDELPLRPPNVDDLAFAMLVELGWVDYAPADDPRHEQGRLF